jgi:hypothetical protein
LPRIAFNRIQPLIISANPSQPKPSAPRRRPRSLLPNYRPNGSNPPPISTLRPEFTIARLQEWQRGTLPDLLGVRIVALAQGTLTGELTSNPARQKITARA